MKYCLSLLLAIVYGLMVCSHSFASERCVEQYGGICKEVCSASEESAEGAFIDCSDNQNCCVKRIRSSESKEKAYQAEPTQKEEK